MKLVKYKVLVLTDHLRHSASNSLYVLVLGFLNSSRCDRVDIASRGMEENYAFFHEMDTGNLHAAKADINFTFEKRQAFLERYSRLVDVQDYDFICLRLPRPVSDVFLRWLTEVFKGKVIVNSPAGIIQSSTKAFLLQFPALCPSMKLCTTVEDVLGFAEQFPIVLKPLREYGGRGLLKIFNEQVDDGEGVYDLVDYLPKLALALANDGCLAMKFLRNVNQGDKRIVVVDDEIMGASLRIPPSGSWLCNIAQGGIAQITAVTPEEETIVATLAKPLKALGILIFGVDTLVDDTGKRVLSEVNTLSIGGFSDLELNLNRPIISRTVEKLFKYADAKYLE